MTGIEGRKERRTGIDSGWERTRGGCNRGEEGEDDCNIIGVYVEERRME